ncbi:MAG: CopG family transcriptional regulator [Chloroflexi bacterium]|nr:MAG: CopG family transcriptional regulator [Chloroflexota bacterium]
MRRTTILLQDDLADQLDYERRRQNRSTAAIVREALMGYLAGGKSSNKRLPFVGLGASGKTDTARNAEEILIRELGGKRKPGGKRRNR